MLESGLGDEGFLHFVQCPATGSEFFLKVLLNQSTCISVRNTVSSTKNIEIVYAKN